MNLAIIILSAGLVISSTLHAFAVIKLSKRVENLEAQLTIGPYQNVDGDVDLNDPGLPF